MEAHVAAIVDTPNACVTMGLPVAIFDRDIRPLADGSDGPTKRDMGQCALRSDGERCIQPPGIGPNKWPGDAKGFK